MIDHLAQEQQTMWLYLGPMWGQDAFEWIDWRGTDYERTIHDIHAALQHLFSRPLLLSGSDQDSYELATIPLPNCAGAYPTLDPEQKSLTTDSVVYGHAPAVLTFSALGPLATIRDDVHLDPTMHRHVLQVFHQHAVDYVSFRATQTRLPKEIQPYDAYPQSWFEACFTYT